MLFNLQLHSNAHKDYSTTLKLPNGRAYPFDSSDFKVEEKLTVRGHVTKTYHKPSRSYMAVKIISIAEGLQEVKTLKHINNSSNNIILLYGIEQLNGKQPFFKIYLEWMDFSLRKFFNEFQNRKKNANVLAKSLKLGKQLLGYIIVKLIDALHHLNLLKIIHRDVKPENVLLTLSGKVKLCDFGEARIASFQISTEKTLCTRGYRPPEVYSNEPEQVLTNFDTYDVWSLGIIILEFFYDVNPYEMERDLSCTYQEYDMNQYEKLIDWRNSDEFNKCVSEEFYEILSCCLKFSESRDTPLKLKGKEFYSRFKNFTESDGKKIINYFMINTIHRPIFSIVRSERIIRIDFKPILIRLCLFVTFAIFFLTTLSTILVFNAELNNECKKFGGTCVDKNQCNGDSLFLMHHTCPQDTHLNKLENYIESKFSTDAESYYGCNHTFYPFREGRAVDIYESGSYGYAIFNYTMSIACNTGIQEVTYFQYRYSLTGNTTYGFMWQNDIGEVPLLLKHNHTDHITIILNHCGGEKWGEMGYINL